YRRAIEQHPDLRRAKFVQWAAPSRTEIPDYQAERLAVEDAAVGVEALAPGVLSMSYEAHERSDVLALLERADVCVVSSLADGMNLVAKEFAALHSAERPGVLILSDACGAAEELTDALIYPADD